MYQSYYPFYDDYGNEEYLNFDSIPYQMEEYGQDAYDMRQLNPPPFFPGGVMGPKQGPPSFSPPFGQPSSGGGQQGPPSGPPPSFVPAQTQQAGVFAVDPGSIRRCMFRYTYVWLHNGQQFWMYPIFVGRRSVSGWRWTGYRWVYFGIDLRQIQSFTCV